MLPLNGVQNKTVPFTPTIDLTSVGITGQPISRSGTITSVSGFQSLTQALSLVGSTITTQVQVWQASSTSNTYTAVPGAVVTLSPSLTGLASIGTTSSGITTGLAIPVTAGSKYIVVVSAQATGLSLISTINANVGASVTIS